MLGLDVIASELENPFGDDANDLPMLELQHEMNRNLMCFLQPQAWDVPELTKRALFSFEELAEQNTRDRCSLEEYQTLQQSWTQRIKAGKGITLKTSKDTLGKQMRWAKQETSETLKNGLMTRLRATIDEIFYHHSPDTNESTDRSDSDHLDRGRSTILAPTALTPKPHCSYVRQSVSIPEDEAEEEEVAGSLCVTESGAATQPSPGIPPASKAPDKDNPPWRLFLADLDKSLKSYLDNQMQRVDEQLQSLGSLQKQHVLLIERVLAAPGGEYFQAGANKECPSRSPPRQSSSLRCCATVVAPKEVLR